MSSTDGSDHRPWLSELTEALLVFFAAGASVGAAAWFVGYDELTALIRDNAMPRPARQALLTVVWVAGAVGTAGALGYALWKRTAVAIRAIHRAARIATPLTLWFAFPLLLDGYAYRDRALLFCIAAAGLGLCLERSLRLSFEALPWGVPSRVLADLRLGFPRVCRAGPTLLVGTLALGLAVYMSVYGVMHHYRLQTRALDLAIFDNLMWNLLRGEWYQLSPGIGGGSHLQTHASFGAILLAPLYALRQQADTLIVIQAGLCAFAVIPITCSRAGGCRRRGSP